MQDGESKISVGIELCLVLKQRLTEYSKIVNEATHLLLLMNKLIKTGKALRLLMTKDYFEDASILTRSVFEIVVLFLWIIKEDTSIRIKRHKDFVSFDYADHIHRYLKHIQQRKVPANSNKEQQSKIDNAIREDLIYVNENIDITDLLNEYRAENIDLKNYKRKLIPSIKKMADDVEMDQQYLSSYWFDSSFVHSGADSLHNYEEDESTVRTSLKSTVVNDFLYYIYRMSYWTNKKFHFGLDDSIGIIGRLTVQAMNDHWRISRTVE